MMKNDSCFIGVFEVDEDPEEELDKPRVANNPNSVLNEMWFLTIHPFVGIPVFIAKLSER